MCFYVAFSCDAANIHLFGIIPKKKIEKYKRTLTQLFHIHYLLAIFIIIPLKINA